MKVALFLFAGTMICFYSCTDKEKSKERTETRIIREKNNGEGKPDVKIKVNKRYDKKGNLISFDSTYTSYYSNTKGDKVLMDRLVKEFKSPFAKEFPFMNDRYFKNLFYTDSLLDNDFFHEDFFRKRYELNVEYMKQMMRQMDSVKNEYFKERSIKLKQKK